MLQVMFVLFAEETHSTKEIQQKWKDELNGQIFFSHSKSNSPGDFIAFFGSKSVTITKEISDNNGCKLVLQVKIDDKIYLLVNLYNSNTELDQLETLYMDLRLSSLNLMLMNIII